MTGVTVSFLVLRVIVILINTSMLDINVDYVNTCIFVQYICEGNIQNA